MPQSTDVKSYFGSKPDWVSVLIALFLIWRFEMWHLVFATVISVILSAGRYISFAIKTEVNNL